jgi:hypothetical protein
MGISLAATAMAGVPLLKELHITTKGIPEGVPVDFKVKSRDLNAHVGFESGTKTRLMDLKPGNYKLELPDILYAGYTWTAKSPILNLKLTQDGKIFNNLTKKRIANPVSLSFKLKSMPTAVNTSAIYPTSTRGLWSCDSILLNDCTQLDTKDQIGLSGLVVEGNGFVYTSDGQHIYKCDPSNNNSCVQLDDAGSTIPIVSLIYANNRLYAGLNSGILWSCDPNAANSCTNLDNAGKNTSILSLVYGDNRLYAGLEGGILWSCEPNTKDQCHTLDTAGGDIAVLAYGDGRLYVGINDANKTLWNCDPYVINNCQDITKLTFNYISMLYANSRIYVGTNQGLLYSCDPAATNPCTSFRHPLTATQSGLQATGTTTNKLPLVIKYSDATGHLYVGMQWHESKLWGISELLTCDTTTLDCIVLDNPDF